MSEEEIKAAIEMRARELSEGAGYVQWHNMMQEYLEFADFVLDLAANRDSRHKLSPHESEWFKNQTLNAVRMLLNEATDLLALSRVEDSSRISEEFKRIMRNSETPSVVPSIDERELENLKAENQQLRENVQELEEVSEWWMKQHDRLQMKYEPKVAVMSQVGVTLTTESVRSKSPEEEYESYVSQAYEIHVRDQHIDSLKDRIAELEQMVSGLNAYGEQKAKRITELQAELSKSVKIRKGLEDRLAELKGEPRVSQQSQ